MPDKLWPPSGFPIIEGLHNLTDNWSINPPDKFTRRIEDGSLVIWRPGITIWIEAWGNDDGESQPQRLESIKASASSVRFNEREIFQDNLTRFTYHLSDANEDNSVDSVYGFILNDDGHLQIAVYFDNPADAIKAINLVERVTERPLV